MPSPLSDSGAPPPTLSSRHRNPLPNRFLKLSLNSNSQIQPICWMEMRPPGQARHMGSVTRTHPISPKYSLDPSLSPVSVSFLQSHPKNLLCPAPSLAVVRHREKNDGEGCSRHGPCGEGRLVLIDSAGAIIRAEAGDRHLEGEAQPAAHPRPGGEGEGEGEG